MPRVSVPVTVRWSDMDAFGHVNNVAALRLLEEARVRAFEDLREGDGPGLLERGVVVARHEVEYLVPFTWQREPVAVDLWVTHVGGASFDLGYEVHDGAAGGARAPWVRAATTAVSYDVASGATRRLGAGERAVLEAWRDGPVAFRRRSR